jgi:hypothetical protein
MSHLASAQALQIAAASLDAACAASAIVAAMARDPVRVVSPATAK